jgi:hypothetical protein
MTSEESKQLKVGNRVCFDGEQTDCGKITVVQARYVTIKWDDGHESLTGHDHMKRIERVPGRKPKS